MDRKEQPDSLIDDARLMERVQAGRHEMFEHLVRRYRSAMLRVAESKLGHTAWAEDVVQETLLAVFAARHTFDPTFSFRTWLWTILLNLCRKQWSKSQRRAGDRAQNISGKPLAEVGFEPTTEENGLTSVLNSERQQLLQTLLAELPEPQADAIRLRFFGGLKYSEIAQAMGSSLSAAKSRVAKGLSALSTRLKHDSDLREDVRIMP